MNIHISRNRPAKSSSPSTHRFRQKPSLNYLSSPTLLAYPWPYHKTFSPFRAPFSSLVPLSPSSYRLSSGHPASNGAGPTSHYTVTWIPSWLWVCRGVGVIRGFRSDRPIVTFVAFVPGRIARIVLSGRILLICWGRGCGGKVSLRNRGRVGRSCFLCPFFARFWAARCRYKSSHADSRSCKSCVYSTHALKLPF